MNKFTLAIAILLTLAVALTTVVSYIAYYNYYTHTPQFYIAFITIIILIIIINYRILNYILKIYNEKQIQSIKHILPKDFNLEKNDLVKLSEKVSEINQKNTTKIDAMQEMENYRREYIGNISHELKTPLFSIQGYIETLIEGGVEDLNIRDKYLDRVDKLVQRLLGIVKDLDMISQFEAGKIQLNYSSFDIKELAIEIAEAFDLEASKKGAKIQLDALQTSTIVHADKQKITQVLTNLIANAIHYSNRDKAIVTIKIRQIKNKAIIQIIDNGMGIKPEALPRIFERFYRVESSRSRREGGSGLGLAIVKHIMEAHNQKITVESTYLENTTFTISLDIV